MTVSVIIPAYNRATLLPRTLDAVLAQTAPPDEIIVVDDGSTDGTPEVARRYGGRVRCIVTVNGGDLAARNIGLRAALGRLVAFCDSDDLWRPDFLASMLTLWQAEPRMRAAYADFVLVRDDVWDSNSKFAAAPAGYWNRLRAIGAEMGVFDLPVVDRLIRFQPFFQSCLVLHRQAFLAIGGWDEGAGRVVGADFATSLRLAEHPPLGVVRRPLVGVRKHAGNYSADVQAMNLGDARVLEYVLATRPGLRALAGPIRASIERRRLAALDTAFARRDFAAVVEIAALLSQPPPRLTDIKRRVAALPRPVRDITARALLAAGALRSTIYQRRAT
jgi:glycosyltransferase involved in cell wall biosynthesis